MKKLLLIIFAIFTFSSASALAAQDPNLIFNTTDGKYIYCNNYEALRRSDLADHSNENAKYIMSNPDMEANKYSMFVSHTNNTALYDKDHHVIAPGFDIEVDVLFKAEEDTEIEFTKAGFEVSDNSLYW